MNGITIRPTGRRWTLGLLLLMLAGSAVATEADTYLKNARDYLSRHEYKSAVIELKNVLQQNPDYAEARFLLGKIYLDQSDGAAAEKELARALAQGISPEKAMPLLGRAYLMQGKADKVLSEVKVADQAPADVRGVILTLHGDARLILKAPDKARQAYKAALKLSPGLSEARLGLARLDLVAGKTDKASSYVSKVLTAEPDNVDALLLKGELLYRSARPEEALATFSRAHDLKPASFQAQLGKVMAEVRLSKFDDAEKDLAPLIKRAPSHPVVNYFHAVVLFQRHDLDGAEDALNKVLKVAPDHAQSLLLLGVVNYLQGDLEQSEYYLKSFVTAVPGHLPGRKLLAAVYIKLKQPKQAIETLDVVAPDSADAQSLALLGTAYLQSGDSEKGTEYLQRAVKLAPNLAAIRAQLALGRLASGEDDAAVSELQTAIDLGQDTPMADILLVYTHLHQKEYDKAIAAARALVKKHPESAMALNVLGVSYANAGRRDEARKQFEKVLKQDPKYTAAYMGLAQIAQQEGKSDEARKHYLDILKVDAKNLGAMLALARMANDARDRKTALEWINKAREANPKAIEPKLLLANARLIQGEPLKALAVAREAYEVNPKHPMVLTLLGKIQAANGDLSSAQTTFRKLADAQPRSPQPLLLLAKAQADDKQFEAAAETLEQAVKLDKRNVPAKLMLGRVSIQLERYKRAEEMASALQQESPKFSPGYELEGDINIARNHLEQAIKSYRMAFAKGKTGALAVKLHRALNKAGQQQEAVEPLEKWLQVQPKDDSARLLLAMAYQNLDEKEKAIKQYKTILDSHPDNVVVLNNLAWVYQKQGDKRALDVAAKAISLATERPAVMDTVGWIYVQNDMVDKGLPLLQDARVKAPHIAEIGYHLAVAMHKAGRNEEARKELRRLIRDNKDFESIEEAKQLLHKLEG